MTEVENPIEDKQVSNGERKEKVKVTQKEDKERCVRVKSFGLTFFSFCFLFLRSYVWESKMKMPKKLLLIRARYLFKSLAGFIQRFKIIYVTKIHFLGEVTLSRKRK